MAWKSWRKWVGVGIEIGSVFLPGALSKAADKGAEKLEEAERERKAREAEQKREAVIDPKRDLL